MRQIVYLCIVAGILLLIPGCAGITPTSYISIDTPDENSSVFAEERDFYVTGSYSPDILNPGNIRIELYSGDTPAGTPIRSIVSWVNESGVTARDSIEEDYPNGTSFDYGLIMAPDIVNYPGGIENASNKVVVTEDYYSGLFLGGVTKNFDTGYAWPDGTPLEDLTARDYTILVTGLSGDAEGLTATKTIHLGLTHAALGRYSPQSQMDALTTFARENNYRLYTDPFPGYFVPPNAPSELYEIKNRWMPNNAIEVVNDREGTVIDTPDSAENDLILYNIRNTSTTNIVETAALIRYGLIDSERTICHYYTTGEPVIEYTDIETGTETALTGTLTELSPEERLVFTRADIRPKNNVTDENIYIVGSETPIKINTNPNDGITVTTGDEFCLFGVVKPIESPLTPLEHPYSYMPEKTIATLTYTIKNTNGTILDEQEKQVILGRVYDPQSPDWISYSVNEFASEFSFDTPGRYTLNVAGYDTDGTFVDGTENTLNITVREVIVVPQDYLTIQEAVNAASAGATIIVKNGTYPEELMLNKTVTLLGEGRPVISSPELGTGAKIEADNVTISGFSFEGNGFGKAGIDILGDDCTIGDTEISGYITGLRTGRIEGLSLFTSALHDNIFNLNFGYPPENPCNSIDETVTVNDRPVIYREGESGETIDASSNAGMVICVECTDITISDVTPEAVAQGVILHLCRNVIVDHITADRTYQGIAINSSEDITVQRSSFGPEQVHYGIAVEYTTGLQTKENIIFSNGNAIGVSLLEVDNITISNNTMGSDAYNIGAGVFFYEVANITIADNTMCTTQLGVAGFEVLECVLTGNTIAGSPGSAIIVLDVHDAMVTQNTMDAAQCGIMVQGNVERVTVSDNTIHCNDTGYGMMLAGDEIDVIGNTAENCSFQALMWLNNSLVKDNYFSGTTYPNIFLWNYPWSGDVYVYRNDFVLTAGDAPADATITDTTVTDSWQQGKWGLADETLPGTLWADTFLSNSFRDTTFSTMADMPTQRTNLCMNTGMDDSVWHSPTEETYCYRGQAFTRFMGNYWSTYNGTDTTHDGIGDTPFTIRENETDTCPLTDPSAWYLNKNPDSGDEDASADMATAGALSAGESATLTFTGSAVQAVRITAAGNTGRILLTLDQAITGPDGLTGPVYQFLNAQLSGMTANEISEAEFSFRVPGAWLKAEGILPAELALWRYHDGAWQQLPTTLLREEGGWIYFKAVSPGLSSFAIAGSAAGTVVTDSGKTDQKGNTETAVGDDRSAATPESGNETVTEPQVTAPISEGERPIETTTPQETPLGFIPVVGAAGALFLFRRR